MGWEQFKDNGNYIPVPTCALRYANTTFCVYSCSRIPVTFISFTTGKRILTCKNMMELFPVDAWLICLLQFFLNKVTETQIRSDQANTPQLNFQALQKPNIDE